MEAILAVAVCGAMGTGIVIAVQNIAKLSYEAKRESALSRIIYNRLMFEATNPSIEEGKNSVRVDEWDVEIETEISPLEGLVNQDQAEITGLYKVEIKAVWWGGQDYEELSVVTWRNPILYSE